MATTATNPVPFFAEEQFIQLILLLGDSQAWINEQEKRLLHTVPIIGTKKLLRKTYYLGAGALAHIIERHYFKTQRHPCTGKFTINLIDVLACLRSAGDVQPEPIAGSLNFKRVLKANMVVGYDKNRRDSFYVTVITDSGGRVVTGFPGEMDDGRDEI